MAMSSPQTDTSQGTAQAPARLYLAPAQGYQLHGLLGQLAQLYGLDVYGTSRLTRRAGIEMGFVALLLTVIFLFDLIAWTLLWNVILQSGILKISLWTIPALFGGLLFAFATFIYERQFVTADTTTGLLKMIGPVSLRIIVIVIAAVITSQPIELLVFKGPIDRRIHEESVRLEAVSRLRVLKDARKAAAGIEEQTGTHVTIYKEANQKSEDARKERTRLQTQYEKARYERDRADASAREASRRIGSSRTENQRDYWRGVLAAAISRRDSAQGRMNELQLEVKKSEEDEKHYDQERDDALKPILEKEKSAEDDVKRLQNWIAQINTASAGQPQTENNDRPDKWHFRDQDYDFFERLRVIADLYTGRPPDWANTTSEDRKDLGSEYGLKEFSDDDVAAISRRMINAEMFARSYWAVFGIAMVIPLLVLALKALLPRELKEYYSSSSQQKAGNYEMLVFSREADQGELVCLKIPAPSHQQA